MSERVLAASDLVVRFGAREVLRGVSLALHRGELVALLGPNGAGKTTLVRALAGLLHPHRGSIHTGTERAAIAYVAQNEPLPSALSVHDVVRLGRLPHHGAFAADLERTPQDRRAIARALERTSLTVLSERRIGELSGGEQRRVALARALAQQPRVLLLDEPTTHLDVRQQLAWIDALREERAQGLAALLVMHDLALAARADRVMLLAEGTVAHDGPPERVLAPGVLETVYGIPIDVRVSYGRAAPEPER
jgi:iron complex transport system ATP-binding protein